MKAWAACALAALLVVPAAAEPRRSGFDYMSPATQAMQRYDAANPAFLWLRDGEQRFRQDCLRCHAVASMKGVAARYPAFDDKLGRALGLAERVRQCQSRHLGRTPAAWESDELLALETFVVHQSRGLPIQAPADPRLAPALAQGEALWRQPLGQLGLSCLQCHDALAGRRLGGSAIPQGHATGYPAYRLEWQALGSLQRRLRHCQSGVRAEPFAYGSEALTALELFLNRRAAGLPIETPAVRP